ncbi:MAG: RsmE family RNA methyltransferase [Bryobacterales bacterium]|nr:RsmE family RNA methyltransferase [Bryobacterales bacterium]
MARRRFFVDEVREGRARLTGESADHLRRVLRARAGERFELSDNRNVYLAEIEGFRRGEVLFRILEALPAERPPLQLVLQAALIKFDRFEWLIEKATELGVEQILPVIAARSEKGLEVAAVKRLERWRRIAREASQQARRARLPEIGRPLAFRQALAGQFSWRAVLDELRTGAPLLAALPPATERRAQDRVALLVGPEGGWTEEEREAARAAGWRAVTLATSVLRAETAAIAAVAIVMNAWMPES